MDTKNKINGRIVRADNGQGIENLKVVVFDIDSASSIARVLAGDGKIKPNISPSSEHWSTPAAERWSKPALEMIKLFFGLALEEDSELRGDAPSGDRLGSVLTDSEGKFELEFSDITFNDEGKEKRPDILLAVIGPDTSVVIEGHGFGLPEFERLVHIALFASWNAGRQESFFLRIPKELHGIAGFPVVEEQKKLTKAEVLKQSLENQKREKEEIKKVRREFSQKAIFHEVELKAKSKNIVKNILSNLASEKDKPYFISGILPARERAAIKNTALEEAQKAGINRLNNMGLPGPNDTVIPKALKLKIPENILFPLFPDWNTRTNPSYKVSVETVCGLLNLTAGGRKLVRSRTLQNLIDENLPIENSENQEEEDSGDVQGPTVGPDLSGLTIQERIQHLLFEQISDVVISQPVDPKLPRSTLARLQSDLDNAIISSGPADTTSFHDIHTLQIAFENVWTEALSTSLEELISETSVHIMKLQENQEALNDVVSLQEIDSISELLRSGNEIADVNQDSVRIPEQELRYLLPDIRITFWDQLTEEQRDELESIAMRPFTYSHVYGEETSYPALNVLGAPIMRALDDIDTNIRPRLTNERRLEVKTYIDWVLRNNEGVRLVRLLKELSAMLTENYRFEHFEKDSVNYGIVTTYRITNKPLAYQCGNLVKTVPLAPGESKSYEVTQTRNTSRARKEIEKNELARSFDSKSTNRLDTEIMRRAEEATNFATNTTGAFNLAIGSITNTTSFQADQKRHSQDITKSYHENLLNKIEEFKSETSLEVNLTDENSYSIKETGELKNPNNELTVTYLLYELERQYEISEKIHALTPVVMVAQEMPAPDDITEAWLLRYDWILKRALLDQQFMPSIDMLRKDFVSNEVSINLKKANWQTQLSIVEKLQGETSELLEQKRNLHDQLITAEYNADMAANIEDSGGFLHRIAKAITPFDPVGLMADSSEAYANQAKSLLEVAENEFANAAEKLANSREALNSAAKEYSSAVESTTQRRTLIDQLRIHVKDNILHYMQAIWSYEPDDQRYFRLYKKSAFFPRDSRTELTVRPATAEDSDGLHIPGVPGYNVVIEGLGVPEWVPSGEDDYRPLHEVADLDKPLGFKGNYMLFPLKECNLITDFMMGDFFDGYFGLKDPNKFAEFPNSELEELHKVLKQKEDQLRALGDTISADAKDAEANIVKSIIGQRLDSTHRDVDTISLPTGQLYMEALVGKNTLLEPFKLAHRGYDALVAREELRRKGLENLRYAARMTSAIPNFEDPDIDKNIKINRGNDIIVDTD